MQRLIIIALLYNFIILDKGRGIDLALWGFMYYSSIEKFVAPETENAMPALLHNYNIYVAFFACVTVVTGTRASVCLLVMMENI